SDAETFGFKTAAPPLHCFPHIGTGVTKGTDFLIKALHLGGRRFFDANCSDCKRLVIGSRMERIGPPATTSTCRWLSVGRASITRYLALRNLVVSGTCCPSRG